MQGTKGVKISVVTATYNCATTIEDCMTSIQRQTWANKEHVVVDGASSDGTIEKIRQLLMPGFYFVSERDSGIYNALNKGIRAATGDVVGFLHADDLYKHGQVLERIASAFEDPEVGGVYGDLQYVRKDDIGRVVRHWRSASFSTARLKWGWMPPHPTLYIRKKWYAKIGGFKEELKVSADYDSILKLFSAPDFKSVYIPEVLVTMRLGGNSNRSLKNIIKKTKEDFLALRDSGAGVIGASRSVIWKNAGKVSQFFTFKS